jgi:hypothetical protein
MRSTKRSRKDAHVPHRSITVESRKEFRPHDHPHACFESRPTDGYSVIEVDCLGVKEEPLGGRQQLQLTGDVEKVWTCVVGFLDMDVHGGDPAPGLGLRAVPQRESKTHPPDVMTMALSVGYVVTRIFMKIVRVQVRTLSFQ